MCVGGGGGLKPILSGHNPRSYVLYTRHLFNLRQGFLHVIHQCNISEIQAYTQRYSTRQCWKCFDLNN